MNADDKIIIEHAERIKTSADRLLKLCELTAPTLIIEKERQLLFSKLFKFPVDKEAQTRNERINNEMAEKEQSFLVENGYYRILGSEEP